MKWIIVLMPIIQGGITSLRYLCLSQNNNYGHNFYNRRFFEFFALNALFLVASTLIVFLLKTSILDELIKLLFYICLILTTIAVILRFQTKLKFTKRAVSILFVEYIAIIIATAIPLIYIDKEKYQFLYTSLIGMFSPVFLHISLLIVNPYFERKNKRFFEEKMRILRRSNLIKIGITGSYGKTTCKKILEAILSKKYHVIATEKNYNTPMGLALSVDKIKEGDEVFIAEMGARHKGDIKYLAENVCPDYSITTGVCEQHIATFKSIHNIFLEKSELSKHTQIKSVFNCNDKYVLKMYKECMGGKIMVCSNKRGDIYAENIVTGQDGSKFEMVHKNGRIELQTKLLGRHNIINIALCVALALELNVDENDIIDAVKNLQPVSHRLEYSFQNGIHILDDGYNGNVAGVKCALDVLSSFDGRKVVVAQGIVEGGKRTRTLNKRVGREIGKISDVVILCGRNAKYIGAGLDEIYYSGSRYVYRNLNAAKKDFAKILKSGDVLLLQNDLPDVY